MTNQTDIYIEKLVRDNAELIQKILCAESEIKKMRLENDNLRNTVQSLTEKVVDANNEVARMSMMMKHHQEDLVRIKHMNKSL